MLKINNNYEAGFYSFWSKDLGNYTPELVVNYIDNRPPETPKITDPKTGKPNTEYIWGFQSFDSDKDNIRYHINWGDGYVETTDYNLCGLTINIPHTYKASGNYKITAHAEDEHGLQGPETEYPVIIPKNKDVNRPIQQFFQSYPNIFLILRQLLGL
jgi:hypothetical protein